jgi:hypothetical protein
VADLVQSNFVRLTDLTVSKLRYWCIFPYAFGILANIAGLESHWLNAVVAIPIIFAGILLLARVMFGKWMLSTAQMGFQSNRQAILYLMFTYRGFQPLPACVALVGAVILIGLTRETASSFPVFATVWTAGMVLFWTRKVPADLS